MPRIVKEIQVQYAFIGPGKGIKDGIRIDLIDASEDEFRFHAVVLGPAGSVYEGGEWHYEYKLDKSYPFIMPYDNIKSLTKLYHPDVTDLETGLPHFLSCEKCFLYKRNITQTMPVLLQEWRQELKYPNFYRIGCPL